MTSMEDYISRRLTEAVLKGTRQGERDMGLSTSTTGAEAPACTLETINRAIALMKDIQPIPEIRVVPVGMWPKKMVQAGTDTRIIRRDAHPIIRWLARFLPIIPYVEWPVQIPRYIEVDSDPIRMENTIYCSPGHAEQIKAKCGSRSMHGGFPSILTPPTSW